MESQDPRVRQLETLAEKQMKTMLHSRFLQNCRRENVVPQGLTLKLKIHVGTECEELQNTVDSLLSKVSGDICDRICEYQHRRSEEYGREMDIIHTALKQKVGGEKLFDIDTDISRKTESKKEEMLDRHEKKLQFLKEKLIQNSRVLSSDEHSEQSATRKKKKRAKNSEGNKNKHVKQNMKSTSGKTQSSKPEQRIHNGSKDPKLTANAPSSDRDQQRGSTASSGNETKPDNNSQSTLNQPSSKRDKQQEPANLQKNGGPRGTYKKTYSEAVKNGAATRNTLIQTTMETLIQAMSNFQTVLMEQSMPPEGKDKDALYEYQTERRGRKQRKDFRKSRKGRQQY